MSIENGAVLPTDEQGNKPGAADQPGNADIVKLQDRIEQLESEKAEEKKRLLSEIAEKNEMAARRKRQKNSMSKEKEDFLDKYGLEDMTELDEIMEKHQETLSDVKKQAVARRKLEAQMQKVTEELNHFKQKAFIGKRDKFINSIIEGANILTSKAEDARRLVSTYLKTNDADEFVLQNGNDEMDQEKFVKSFVESHPEWVATKAKPGVSMKSGIPISHNHPSPLDGLNDFDEGYAAVHQK